MLVWRGWSSVRLAVVVVLTLLAALLVAVGSSSPARADAGAGGYVPLSSPVRVAGGVSIPATSTAGATAQVQITGGVDGVPTSGVSAVDLTVTGTSAATSFLTVYPYGSSLPNVSNVSLTPNVTAADTVLAVPGSSGYVSIYSSRGATTVYVDVYGYYTTGSGGSDYHPLTVSQRLLSNTTLTGNSATSVQVEGAGGIPYSGVSVVVGTLTGANPSTNGNLRCFPDGDSVPGTANVNLTAGRAVGVLVQCQVGGDGKIAIYNASGSVSVLFDAEGWYSADGSGSASAYHVINPAVRVNPAGTAITAGTTIAPVIVGAAGVPQQATVVALNITAASCSVAGAYLEQWPAGAPAPSPATSVLNTTAGTVSDLVLASVGSGGAVNLSLSAGHCTLYFDVSGYFRSADPLTGAGSASYFTNQSYSLTDRAQAQVNEGTGNLALSLGLLAVPGVDGDLPLTATYNSLAEAAGSSHAQARGLAAGWNLSVAPDVELGFAGDGTITFYDPSGFAAHFRPAGSATYLAPAGFDATLTTVSGGFTLTYHQSGTVDRFDSSGALSSVTDRSGNAYTMTRDPAGHLTAVTGTRGGAAATISVNSAGPSGDQVQSLSQQPAAGSNLPARSLTFGYSSGQLSSITDPAGTSYGFGYAGGQLTSVTAGPSSTTFGYESGNTGRVASVGRTTGSGTASTTFGYDDTAAPMTTTITDPTGVVRTVSRDSAGRVSKTVDAWGGQISATSYDGSADNKPTAFTSAATGAAGMSMTYGANGGESLTSAADNGGGPAASAAYGGNCGAAGGSSDPYQPCTSTDPANNTSNYSYDGSGNLASNKDANAAQAVVEHNTSAGPGPAGTVKFSTDPNNVGAGSTHGAACQRTVAGGPITDNCTVYTYNAAGEISSVTPPDNAGALAARSYTYDGFGRLATATDGAGNTRTYSYDSDDRPVAVSTANAGGTTASVAYRYDADGNRIQTTDATGTTDTYDPLGDLTAQDTGGSATSCGPAGSQQLICYAYDGNQRLTALTDGLGTTNYHYNPVGELDQITDPTGGSTVLDYAADHTRLETWTGTGTSLGQVSYPGAGTSSQARIAAPTTFNEHTANTVDAHGQLTETKTTRASNNSAVAADLRYRYTVASSPACPGESAGAASGQITARTDTVSKVTTTNCYTGGRLTSATDSAGGRSYTYTYDRDGNRIAETVNGGSVTRHGYNTANQPNNTQGDTGYGYDPAGNTTATPGYTYTYNGYGQTASINTGTDTFTYTYGGTDQTTLAAAHSAAGTTDTYENGLLGVQSRQHSCTTGCTTTTSYLIRDPKAT